MMTKSETRSYLMKILQPQKPKNESVCPEQKKERPCREERSIVSGRNNLQIQELNGNITVNLAVDLGEIWDIFLDIAADLTPPLSRKQKKQILDIVKKHHKTKQDPIE